MCRLNETMIIHTHTLASKSPHHELHDNVGMQEQVNRVEPGGHTGGRTRGGGKKGQSHDRAFSKSVSGKDRVES
jgi:hypothetical protein